mgnify:CR=1 FL=1
MFRYFSAGVFYSQAALLLVAGANDLRDFRASVEGALVDVAELEALTSASNAGSYCAVARIAHTFIFFVGILLTIVALYVPTNNVPYPRRELHWLVW